METEDKTRAPREGEELDVKALRSYLNEAAPEIKGDLHIEQFPSGHSNLTYLLRADNGQWVLRRPPFGRKIATAHDMGREFRILSKLNAAYPQAPRVLVYEETGDVLGAPFYIMQRINGLILRKDLPDGFNLSPEQVHAMGMSFIDNLAAIHRVDYKAAGLGDLGKPEGYVERQVTGWTKRYFAAKTDEIPAVEQVAEWLAARIPAESGAALIHNDYKYDNIVLDPQDFTKVIGVLDWEMSTIGDPLMDLGTTLGYWVQADDSPEMQLVKFVPTNIPGSPTRQELAERYSELTGADLSYLPFYYAFALFKTAVVAQQLYHRYVQGHSKDQRLAAMIMGVHVLGNEALRVAEESLL